MTQKILFEGWDDFSLEEQKAIQAWIKSILDAKAAKQKFLDIYSPRNSQNSDTSFSDIDLTSFEESYVIMSSVSEEEKDITSINHFLDIEGLGLLDNCIRRCAKEPPEQRDACVKDCREERGSDSR